MISSVCLITGFTASCTGLPIGLFALGFERDAKYEQDFSLKDSKTVAWIESRFNPYYAKQSKAVEESETYVKKKNYFDGVLVRVLTSTTVSNLAALAFLKASLSGPILLQLFHLYLGGCIAFPVIVSIVLVLEYVALSEVFINNPHRWTEELQTLTLITKTITTVWNRLRHGESIVNPTEEFLAEALKTSIESINKEAKQAAKNGKSNQSAILVKIVEPLMNMEHPEEIEPSQSKRKHSFPIRIEV